MIALPIRHVRTARTEPKKGRDISKLILALLRKALGTSRFQKASVSLHEWQRGLAVFIKERRTVKALHVFRHYSSLAVVISSAILVSATNIAAGRQSSGFLFGYLDGAEDNYSNPLESKIFINSGKKTTLALAPLAEAKTVSDSGQQDDQETGDFRLNMQGQALVSDNSPVLQDPEEDGGVQIYEVKQGDTIGSIASANNISVNTILWANEIDNIDSIMPGDKIFILPVSGLSYTVKKGDDIDSIAKQFKADKQQIIAFNTLPADGELKEGEEIVIPGGEKELPKPTVSQPTNPGSIISPRQYDSFTPGKSTMDGSTGGGHRFPYGYCTWYVASRRNIPWSGNAGTWLYHAKAAGYSTGRSPRVGAIMVSSESWWGHVAIVEKVSGSTITISEMNYRGWAKKSTRTLEATSRVIKGFIY